uniref:Ig-like domain-containing protein n=1 Tax=Oryzias latipes TaxID=8090 RepID=A0A3B3I6A6_ORYLA
AGRALGATADVSCEELTAVKKEESTLEGTSVTLSYKYPKLSTSNYFFWYRQSPGKPPEFLVSHSSSGQIGITKIEGLKIQVENKQIDLQISSAAVTDSAVYYCALQPTVTGNNKTLYKNVQQGNTTTSTRGRSNIKKVHVLRKQNWSKYKNVVSRSWLQRSTWPFVCGWKPELRLTLTPNSLQNSRQKPDTN